MPLASLKGLEAENLAADTLQKKGYKILTRNFRTSRGEVDIIAKDEKTIVFVEVRMRTRSDFGGAAASVNRAKQERILRAAVSFIKKERLFGRDLRFDILALDGQSIQHIENAFSHDGLIL